MTKLMAHLVAGYTSDDISMIAARALVRGGASVLEVQLPFSDPSADGPAIQGACNAVLSRGYKVSDGLKLIKRIKSETKAEVCIMSYASLVYTPGAAEFCKKASDAGVSALIIPDLPFDHDEGLRSGCEANGMDMMPVAAPSMASERLKQLSSAGFKYIYAALRAGITGQKTVIDDKTLEFLRHVKAGGSKVYGGFGITNGEQSKLLSGEVYGVVAGSVFVRIINECAGNEDMLSQKIEAKAREIVGSYEKV